MAKNKLTPQQDIVTRQFFVLVAQGANHDESELKRLREICLNLLNYECTTDGRFIAQQAAPRTRPWGSGPEAVGGACEWLDDFKPAIKQGGKDARTNNQDSFTPRSSKSAKNPKVFQAVLPKDV